MLTEAQRAALKTELALPAYAGLSDYQAEIALAAATIAASVDVATADARQVLFATPALEWSKLVAFAASTPTEETAQAIDVAITARDTLRLTDTLVLSDPTKLAATQTMLGVLQRANIVSGASIAAILALADGHVSRAQQLGLGTITHLDIAAARAATSTVSGGAA